MAYQDYLKVRDRVAFNQGPYVQSPSYTDITKPSGLTDNAVRPGGNFATGRQSRNGAFEASSVTLNVGNRDGRYTPFFNGSPYYPLTESCPYIRDVEYPIGSGTYYPIWGGVMSDCSAGFEGRAQGTASLTFQQRVGVPLKKPMRAIAVGQVLNTAPAHFWPLDDPAGSDTAADVINIDYPPLHFGYWGTLNGLAGGAEYDFGSAFAPGDSGGTRIAFNPPSTNTGEAVYFAPTLVGEPALTQHQSALIVSITDVDVHTWLYGVRFAAWTDAPAIAVAITTNSTGTTVKTYYPDFPSAGTTNAIGSSTVIDDGEDHSVGLSITISGTTATGTLYIDGVSAGSAPLFYPTTGTMTLAGCSIGQADTVYGGQAAPHNGTAANFAIWNDANSDRHTLYGQMKDGFTADTADVRLARLADAAGIRNVSSTSVATLAGSNWLATTGTFTRIIGEQQVAGRTFLDCLRELETAEMGRVYTSHDGKITLASSSAYYSPARTLTLSALTHFDLDDDFSVDNDNAVNDWTGTRDGGVKQTYTASDAIIADQGQQSADDGTLPLTTDDDVLYVGSWKVNKTAVPTVRFNKVKVHGSKLHAAGLLDDALNIVEGDQVVLTDLPTGSPVSSFTGFVERIEKQFTADDLKIVFTLSKWINVAEYNSASMGRFADDPGTITLTNTITSSATSISATTLAGYPPLTNAAGDLPFDIDVMGERMTVTAVSSATSPQTLTVTRGVAPSTAAAHNAGTEINIYDPGVLGA